jgi:protocatechuate 3,4-dioxygenase beta subunit
MMLAILLAVLQAAPAARKAASPAASGAVIRGKVLADENGLPLRYASVQLRRSGPTQDSVTVTTNDSGAFEIRDIEPGAYTARAAKPGFVTTLYKSANGDSGPLKLNAGQVEEVIFRLPRAVAISGIVTDAYGEPVNNATVQAMSKTYSGGRAQLVHRATAQTDDRGEYRVYGLPAGRYYLQVTKRPNQSEAGAALATTLFPGASHLEDAQPIVVKPGEDRQGINVTLQEASLFDITGRVFDAESGQPVTNAFLTLLPANGNGFNANDRAETDGVFRIRNVVAGNYRLMVTAPSTDRNKPPMSVTRFLDLTNGAVSELVIRVGPGSTVKGTVKAVGGLLPEGVQVSVSQRAADGTFINAFSAAANADGDFEISHVAPGSYELSVATTARPGSETARFFLASASLSLGPASTTAPTAHDVGDANIEVGDADAMTLSLTIDLRTAAISGKILEAKASEAEDKPVANMNVALVSADPKKRLISRYFHSGRSGRDGSFKLTGLPPGDYLLIPWPGEDAGQVLDHDVFPMIERFATRVSVERGGNVTQDLRMTPELRTLADAFSQ